MRSGEAVAGPIVQTILARRAVVATGARPGAGWSRFRSVSGL